MGRTPVAAALPLKKIVNEELMFLDRAVSAGSRPVMHLLHSFTYIDQKKRQAF